MLQKTSHIERMEQTGTTVAISHRISRTLVASLIILATGVSLASPSMALATTDEELQAQIEQSSEDLDAATARIEELDAQIAENDARVAELEAQLPELETRSDEVLREMYLQQMYGSTFFSLVLGAESWDDFLRSLDYFNRVESFNMDAVDAASAARDELEDTNAQLEQDRADAEQAREDASDALVAAQAAREEAMQRAAEEAAQQAAALEAAAQEQALNSDSSATATETTVENTVQSSEVNWSTDKTAFVSEWAGRIDAYLSGSPLSGYGTEFAAAAWDYGVDPRWSPAISTIESSQGAACAHPYNAWGWLGRSFSSWEDGIDQHVAYLARVYGSTLTPEAAAKYCPPGPDWYNSVYNEMQQI